jgi:hypothetical protein
MENFYKKTASKPKKPKHYPEHYIDEASRILCIGSSGSGKSNSLLSFISRNPVFSRIIIFTGSGTEDEPLYRLLKEKIPEVEFINKAGDLPALDTFDASEQTLMVLDDWITLTKKEQKKIEDFFVGGRKRGITCFAMAQSYTAVPKLVSRNSQYFMIFALPERYTMNHILKNHNIHNVDDKSFIDMYKKATADPLNFFMIDTKNKPTALRHNWNTEIFKV